MNSLTPFKRDSYIVRSVTPPLSPSVLGNQLVMQGVVQEDQHPMATKTKNKNIRWWNEPPEDALFLEKSLPQAEALLFENSDTAIFPDIKVFPNEFVSDLKDDGGNKEDKKTTTSTKPMAPALADVPPPVRGPCVLQNVAIGTAVRRPDKKDLIPLAFETPLVGLVQHVKKDKTNQSLVDEKVQKPHIFPRFQKVIKKTATKKRVIGVPMLKSTKKGDKSDPILPHVLVDTKKPCPAAQETNVKVNKAKRTLVRHCCQKVIKKTATKKKRVVGGVPMQKSARRRGKRDHARKARPAQEKKVKKTKSKKTLVCPRSSQKRSKETPTKKTMPVKLSCRTKPKQNSSLLKGTSEVTKMDRDIIAGRGGESNNHGPGNDFFWVLVLLHRPIYKHFEKDLKKKQSIASNCWDMAQMEGRRFLGRHGEAKYLMELPKEKSLEKTKQALRAPDNKIPKSLLDPQTCQPLSLAELKQRFENDTFMELSTKKSLGRCMQTLCTLLHEKQTQHPPFVLEQARFEEAIKMDEKMVPFLKNVKVLFEGLHQIGALKLAQP